MYVYIFIYVLHMYMYIFIYVDLYVYIYVCMYIYMIYIYIYIIWIQKPSWCQEELPGAQQRAGRPQTFGERLVNLNGQRGSPQLLAPILGPKARHFKL